MLANRLLLLGAALGLVVGCGQDDRAHAAPKAVANARAAAAPVRPVAPKAAAKRAAKP